MTGHSWDLNNIMMTKLLIKEGIKWWNFLQGEQVLSREPLPTFKEAQRLKNENSPWPKNTPHTLVGNIQNHYLYLCVGIPLKHMTTIVDSEIDQLTSWRRPDTQESKQELNAHKSWVDQKIYIVHRKNNSYLKTVGSFSFWKIHVWPPMVRRYLDQEKKQNY